ncbi:hypothetical protein AB0G95_33190 [Streptomyces virginiae]|uniref:hypothetical protein n=1 Tax=Streptomyces virginiae TaxID=1961 RepID=UPI0034290377
MTSSDHLLYLIRSTPEIDLLLRTSFGFDIGRKYHGEGLRLASGAPLEPIAGESAGGAYFLCAEEDGRRPVVFASSEGEGGLIADDLADALEIIIGLEWRDCLGFSGGGDAEVMQVSAQHLERHLARGNPEIAEERTRVAAALSFRVVPVADLVIRLWEAASKTEPGYVVTTEDGEAYDPPLASTRSLTTVAGAEPTATCSPVRASHD